MAEGETVAAAAAAAGMSERSASAGKQGPRLGGAKEPPSRTRPDRFTTVGAERGSVAYLWRARILWK